MADSRTLRMLRLVAMASTLIASILIATRHYFHDAQSCGSLSFQYFLRTSIGVTAYSFGLLFLPQDTMLWRALVVIDLLVTVFLASSLSAAGAFLIEMVEKKTCTPRPSVGLLVQGMAASITALIAVIIHLFLVLEKIQPAINPLLLRDGRL